MTPRCGRPLRRYSRYGIAVLDPVCGKPEGHKGRCLSVAAWRRKLDGNKRRVQDWRRRHAA